MYSLASGPFLGNAVPSLQETAAGGYMWGVCRGDRTSHQGETCIFHPGDPEKEISVLVTTHTLFSMKEDRVLYSAAQLWRPVHISHPTWCSGYSQLPPSPQGKGLSSKRREELREGRSSGTSAPDAALVPAHRSTHLVVGACQSPHRCPRSHRFHEKRTGLEESWRMGVKDSCFFRQVTSLMASFPHLVNGTINLSQQILFECWRCARHSRERCLLLGTYSLDGERETQTSEQEKF